MDSAHQCRCRHPHQWQAILATQVRFIKVTYVNVHWPCGFNLRLFTFLALAFHLADLAFRFLLRLAR